MEMSTISLKARTYGKGPPTSNEILAEVFADNHILGLTPTAGDYVLVLAPTDYLLMGLPHRSCQATGPMRARDLLKPRAAVAALVVTEVTNVVVVRVSRAWPHEMAQSPS